LTSRVALTTLVTLPCDRVIEQKLTCLAPLNERWNTSCATPWMNYTCILRISLSDNKLHACFIIKATRFSTNKYKKSSQRLRQMFGRQESQLSQTGRATLRVVDNLPSFNVVFETARYLSFFSYSAC